MGHISPSNTVTPRVRASTSELGGRGRGTDQSITPSFDLSQKTQQEGATSFPQALYGDLQAERGFFRTKF